MPTYASTANFDLSIDEIVEEAFERCGLQDRTGYQLKTARRSLNLLLAEWSNRGLNLWTIQKQTAALAADTTSLTGTALFGAGADDASQIVEITDLVIRDSDNNEYSCSPISRSTYLNYTVKTSGGRPTQYYLERTVTPKLYVWPAPENSTDKFVSYRWKRIQDISGSVDDVDLPSRFLPCLVTGLAFNLALKKNPDKAALLQPLYEQNLVNAIRYDTSDAFQLVPRRTYV